VVEVGRSRFVKHQISVTSFAERPKNTDIVPAGRGRAFDDRSNL